MCASTPGSSVRSLGRGHGVLLCQCETASAARVFVESCCHRIITTASTFPSRRRCSACKARHFRRRPGGLGVGTRGRGFSERGADLGRVAAGIHELQYLGRFNLKGELLLGVKLSPEGITHCEALATPGLGFAELGPGDLSLALAGGCRAGEYPPEMAEARERACSPRARRTALPFSKSARRTTSRPDRPGRPHHRWPQRRSRPHGRHQRRTTWLQQPVRRSRPPSSLSLLPQASHRAWNRAPAQPVTDGPCRRGLYISFKGSSPACWPGASRSATGRHPDSDTARSSASRPYTSARNCNRPSRSANAVSYTTNTGTGVGRPLRGVKPCSIVRPIRLDWLPDQQSAGCSAGSPDTLMQLATSMRRLSR